LTLRNQEKTNSKKIVFAITPNRFHIIHGIVKRHEFQKNKRWYFLMICRKIFPSEIIKNKLRKPENNEIKN